MHLCVALFSFLSRLFWVKHSVLEAQEKLIPYLEHQLLHQTTAANAGANANVFLSETAMEDLMEIAQGQLKL